MDEFATAPSFAQARGAVAFWDLGEGLPVLVLHGFPDAPIGMTPLVERLVLQEQKTAAYAWILAYSSGATQLASDPVWLDQVHQEWSPGLHRSEWPAVKEILQQPGVGEAVHGWYRDDFGASTSTGDVLVPTLMLHGGNDGCIRPACFTGFEQRFPAGLELEQVDGVGHWLHIEQPDAIAARILHFLTAA